MGTLKGKQNKTLGCCSLEQPCPGLAHFQVPAKPKETSGLGATLGHPEKGQPALGMWPRLCPSGHFSRAQNNSSKAQVSPSHRNKLNQKHKNKSQAQHREKVAKEEYTEGWGCFWPIKAGDLRITGGGVSVGGGGIAGHGTAGKV